MNPALTILHLEDDPADGELVAALLKQDGIVFSIRRVDSRETFEEAIGSTEFDLIISDYTLPGFDGMAALGMARRRQPDAAFILVSGTIGEEIAVDSLKQGAVDYVIKDRINRLPAAVRRAVRETAERLARRQAEERIREQAALLDKTMDAIFVHDLGGYLAFWNKAAERVYGWSADAALGRNRDDVVRSLDPAAAEGARRILMQRGEWSGEVRQVTPVGIEITVASRCTLLRDPQGMPAAILEVNTDITDHKLFEAKLLRGQRLESLGSLAGGIAHDLNNILSPIVMASGLLREQALEESAGRLVAAIQTSAARGTALVRQILSFASGRAGAPVPLNVAHVLRDITRLAEETFPKAIRVDLRLAPALPPVLADPTQLHQVLLNLAVNARDAMPAGGRLGFEADAVTFSNHSTRRLDRAVSGTFVSLTVADTGTGIAPEIQDRIFQPFFTTKDSDHGTGLGLSTVDRIVRSHGGFIELKSAPGMGSRFTVFLPVAEIAPTEAQEATPQEVPLGRGERILLVEDERAVREMMKEALETCHYSVATASDGFEALSLYRRQCDRIDLVITDIGMSGMNGAEFIREVIAINPAARVVCVSGLPEEIQPAAVDPSKIREFIEKPFTTERLLAAIRNALPSS